MSEDAKGGSYQLLYAQTMSNGGCSVYITPLDLPKVQAFGNLSDALGCGSKSKIVSSSSSSSGSSSDIVHISNPRAGLLLEGKAPLPPSALLACLREIPCH